MSAARLHADLQKLFDRDSLGPPRLREAPLAADIAPTVILQGLASTVDRDLEFCRFAPRAFGPEGELGLPPLLYDHDPGIVAGSVERLGYDGLGQLQATVTASHPVARRCTAFSVGARVKQYSVIDHGAGNFEAVITRAELTDISLVKLPVNPRAVITRRAVPSPQHEFYSLMQMRIACLMQLVTVIGETRS